jgi:hypothetical protein
MTHGSTGEGATNEERAARYRVLSDPRELWPQLSEDSFSAAMEAIAEVTGAVLLRSAARLRIPDRVPADVLGITAFASGMGPLLGYWIETGRLDTDDETAAILTIHLEHGRLRAERIRGMLGRLLDELNSAGAEVVLLKGARLARSYYPDPGTRPMSDIDLLVSASDAATARDVLGDMGMTPELAADHATSWASSLQIASLEYDHVDNPLKIDLHTSLDRKVRSSRARFDFSFESDTAEWDGRGGSVRALRPPLLIWHLSVHVAAHFYWFRLLQLVDLVLVSRAHRRPEVWQELLERIDRVGEHRFAYPGLVLAERLAPSSVPPDVLEHLGRNTPARIHRVVDAMSPAKTQRLFHTSIEEALMWADSPWSRFLYIAEKFRPQWMRQWLLRGLTGRVKWRS